MVALNFAVEHKYHKTLISTKQAPSIWSSRNRVFILWIWDIYFFHSKYRFNKCMSIILVIPRLANKIWSFTSRQEYDNWSLLWRQNLTPRNSSTQKVEGKENQGLGLRRGCRCLTPPKYHYIHDIELGTLVPLLSMILRGLSGLKLSMYQCWCVIWIGL